MNYIPDKCNYLIQGSKVNSPFLFFWLCCGKNKGIRFHVIFNIHTTVLQTIGAEGKRRWMMMIIIQLQRTIHTNQYADYDLSGAVQSHILYK